MFEQQTTRLQPPFPRSAVVLTVVVHAAVLAAAAFWPERQRVIEAKPEVTLYRTAPPAPPPPPPPPPAATRSTPRTETKRVVKKDKLEAPTVIPEKLPEAPKPEVAAEGAPETPGEPGGVIGGVVGGVEGGVVGGVVGGTGPVTNEPPKPRNVPAFVIQRDMLEQTAPRLPEVFKQAHRGERLAGMYRVCVGLDGHVYEVTVVKGVPGADEAIAAGVREGWVYKPQQVPVCFLYNMPITIQ